VTYGVLPASSVTKKAWNICHGHKKDSQKRMSDHEQQKVGCDGSHFNFARKWTSSLWCFCVVTRSLSISYLSIFILQIAS
jgi:hypothetical protein